MVPMGVLEPCSMLTRASLFEIHCVNKGMKRFLRDVCFLVCFFCCVLFCFCCCFVFVLVVSLRYGAQLVYWAALRVAAARKQTLINPLVLGKKSESSDARPLV